MSGGQDHRGAAQLERHNHDEQAERSILCRQSAPIRQNGANRDSAARRAGRSCLAEASEQGPAQMSVAWASSERRRGGVGGDDSDQGPGGLLRRRMECGLPLPPWCADQRSEGLGQRDIDTARRGRGEGSDYGRRRERDRWTAGRGGG